MKNKRKRESFDIKKIIVLFVIAIILYGLDYIYTTYFNDSNVTKNSFSNAENAENIEVNSKAEENNVLSKNETTKKEGINIENIPSYNGTPYVEINNNVPYFEEKEYTTNVFENYSELDSLGRCGVAYANVCKEIMPPEGDERGAINSVKPTGWVQAKYDGSYLYNRCHLIGYQLSDEDANKKNLITGTRSFNVDGMLPFENEVAEYIKKNENNHVLYRVTPIFEGENLLASGVEMEAYSVEDNGKGVSFNVYVYNAQKGITIDYATGKSSAN